MTTTGYPAPSLGETGTLPTGVTFVNNGNGTATIAGTPAAATGGVYPITITAVNGTGTTTQSFSLTVDQAPAVTSAASTSFSENTAGTFTVTTTGYPAASLSETGTLPAGVTFTAGAGGTATLSGTPAFLTAGTYPITVAATNAASTTTQAFTLDGELLAPGVHLGGIDHLQREQRRCLLGHGQGGHPDHLHRDGDPAFRGHAGQ